MLAGARLDADEARREAVAALARAVSFKRWCWPLSDPASALSISGIGEVDFWPSLPQLVALEHGGDLTSKPGLLAGGPSSIALSAVTQGDLARSRRWRECLGPYGIGDELMTVCHDRQGCWASVELMRERSEAPFDEHDQRLLAELAPTLGTLVRRSLPPSWPAAYSATGAPAPGTMILDFELRPMSWTPSFAGWLDQLPSSGPDTAMLPPAVYEIGARALAPPVVPRGFPNRVRIRTPQGHWSVLEGAPLEGGDGGIAITIRAASPEEVFDILCRIHDLTRRERELAKLMLAGMATKQLAEALCISPYTVQDHLKAIFAKTGVRSRRELIARLTGQASAL
ncbi:MAG TPA: helix-turn-helix transcriptional regulator [Solirubrobacteraceae bacterium]|jgi:DNA-binding CsgD family transcriptional regulator